MEKVCVWIEALSPTCKERVLDSEHLAPRNFRFPSSKQASKRTWCPDWGTDARWWMERALWESLRSITIDDSNYERIFQAAMRCFNHVNLCFTIFSLCRCFLKTRKTEDEKCGSWVGGKSCGNSWFHIISGPQQHRPSGATANANWLPQLGLVTKIYSRSERNSGKKFRLTWRCLRWGFSASTKKNTAFAHGKFQEIFHAFNSSSGLKQNVFGHIANSSIQLSSQFANERRRQRCPNVTN